ncbi:TPA: hypothetical protein ACH3X2_005407 [Trebouxia sp. C0005]
MTESLATELQGSKTKAEALLMTYDLVRSPERQAIMRVLAMAIQGILSEQEALVFAGSCVQRLSSGHSD